MNRIRRLQGLESDINSAPRKVQEKRELMNQLVEDLETRARNSGHFIGETNHNFPYTGIYDRTRYYYDNKHKIGFILEAQEDKDRGLIDHKYPILIENVNHEVVEKVYRLERRIFTGGKHPLLKIPLTLAIIPVVYDVIQTSKARKIKDNWRTHQGIDALSQLLKLYGE